MIYNACMCISIQYTTEMHAISQHKMEKSKMHENKINFLNFVTFSKNL